jgi:hypothetical protein
MKAISNGKLKSNSKWDWHSFLTPEERDALEATDAAKKKWLLLNKDRSIIVNRARSRMAWEAYRQAHGGNRP